MHSKKLEMIKSLMADLEEEMSYGEDELSDRLGRKKPDVEVVSIKGEIKDPALEGMEEKLGMDLDGDMEMDEGAEHEAMIDDDPEEKLKSRLMKLRGA
jgi:hypothetical protein